MRVHLIAQRPHLGGLGGAFSVGELALGTQGIGLGLAGEIKGAPGEEKEQPHDRGVEAVAEALHSIELAHLGHGQDQRLLRGTLDPHLLALLTQDEADEAAGGETNAP